MGGRHSWGTCEVAGGNCRTGLGMWDIVLCLSCQRYTYKYEDQPEQTFSIQKANYASSNGVFHTVSALRRQLPPLLPGDPKVSQQPLFHLVLWGMSWCVRSWHEAVLASGGSSSWGRSCLIPPRGPYTCRKLLARSLRLQRFSRGLKRSWR